MTECETKIISVRFVFQGSALLEGRSDYNRYDIKECARRYANLCQRALEQAYPYAGVEVIDGDESGMLSGLAKTWVLVRTSAEDEPGYYSDSYEVDAIEQLCDEIYSRFTWEIRRPWSTILEAYRRFRIPIAVIHWACRQELIEEAEKTAGHWEFPLDRLFEVLNDKTLTNCQEVIGRGVADDGTYRFECYPKSILDAGAADFPVGLEALVVVRADDFGVPLFRADNSGLFMSSHADRIVVAFEYLGSDVSPGVWSYDAYARALVAQARQSGIESEYGADSSVEGVQFNFAFDSQCSCTLREMIAQAAGTLCEIIQDAELSLSGGPIWEKAYETDERLFCEKVLVTLLRKMGFLSVRYTHGRKEYGKDCIFSELTRFGELRHYGLQAKAGSVSGSANSEVKEILGQIGEAFEMPYYEVGERTPRYISSFIVAISGHFTENAVEKIREMMPKGAIGSVYFWDREKILSLIAQNWSS